MPCKDYREALIEAVATGAAPSPELRAHVDACASCRAALAEELQLFTAIDAGLHVAANTAVPPSLLPRVRAQLNEQTAPRRARIPAVALATAATLVFAVFFLRARRHDVPEQNPQISDAAHVVLPPEVPAVRRDTPPQSNPSPRGRKHGRPPDLEAPASIEQVSVLIPAGQKAAMNLLLAELQRGTVRADVLLAAKPEQPLQDLQVAPLDISPIELKPITDFSEDLSTPNEKTNR